MDFGDARDGPFFPGFKITVVSMLERMTRPGSPLANDQHDLADTVWRSS